MTIVRLEDTQPATYLSFADAIKEITSLLRVYWFPEREPYGITLSSGRRELKFWTPDNPKQGEVLEALVVINTCHTLPEIRQATIPLGRLYTERWYPYEGLAALRVGNDLVYQAYLLMYIAGLNPDPGKIRKWGAAKVLEAAHSELRRREGLPDCTFEEALELLAAA